MTTEYGFGYSDDNEIVEEVAEDIGPAEADDNKGDDVHATEDENTNLDDDITEEELEEMIRQEELDKAEKEMKEAKGERVPRLVKSYNRTFRTSKLDLTRSTGGSKISKIVGKDADIKL